MNKLPERINVMRVVSYGVDGIVDDLVNYMEKDLNEITIEDCLDWIEDWVAEDFGTNDVIYQDENGNDL